MTDQEDVRLALEAAHHMDGQSGCLNPYHKTFAGWAQAIRSLAERVQQADPRYEQWCDERERENDRVLAESCARAEAADSAQAQRIAELERDGLEASTWLNELRDVLRTTVPSWRACVTSARELVAEVERLTKERDDARRCITSIRTMLGWMNEVPQGTLEDTLRALKGRLEAAEQALAQAHQVIVEQQAARGAAVPPQQGHWCSALAQEKAEHEKQIQDHLASLHRAWAERDEARAERDQERIVVNKLMQDAIAWAKQAATKWVCKSCGYSAPAEREVLCPKCGGEMTYHSADLAEAQRDAAEAENAKLRKKIVAARGLFAQVADHVENGYPLLNAISDWQDESEALLAQTTPAQAEPKPEGGSR